MKNLLKTIAVLLFASITTFAGTNGISSDKEENEIKFGMYYNPSLEKIRTFYENTSGEKLEVLFMDAEGKVISRTLIAKRLTSARLDIDVSNLADGDYIIKISNEKEVLTRAVTINTTKPVKELKF